MASVTLPLTFLTTLSGQAANVVATITSIAGGTLRATISAGWTEDTDATGAANAVYLNSVVADTSWGACRVKYTITGQAGVYGYDDVLLDFAAENARLTPGSLNLQLSTGTGNTPINHDTGGTDNLRVLSSGNPVAGAVIRVYLKSDYVANALTASLLGWTVSGPDGRWVTPVYVTAGATYAVIASAVGDQAQELDATV